MWKNLSFQHSDEYCQLLHLCVSGIKSLTYIVQHTEANCILQHQTVIMECLDHPDVSLKTMVCKITNIENAQLLFSSIGFPLRFFTHFIFQYLYIQLLTSSCWQVQQIYCVVFQFNYWSSLHLSLTLYSDVTVRYNICDIVTCQPIKLVINMSHTLFFFFFPVCFIKTDENIRTSTLL